jgi:hypothetical protein
MAWTMLIFGVVSLVGCLIGLAECT